MTTKNSHLKTSVLIAVMTLPSIPALADDYLMSFVVNGENKGEFIVSKNGEYVTAESSLWQVVGVNTNEALPLERLRGLGTVKTIWSSQLIYFYPDKIDNETATIEPEVIIKPSASTLTAKSFDYFLTHHSNSDDWISGSIIGTGRAGEFDLDIRAGVGSQESFFSAQWHDESNSYVRDIELGRVQRHGLDGVGLNNERSLAAGTFATDQVELFWPVDTRVDVYRNGTYIESVTIDSEPYPYKIEMSYANNKYEFRAILPDGRIDKRAVERAISGRLTPVGKLNYRVAAGQEPNSDSDKLIGYLSYGVTPEISFFAGQNEEETPFLSSLIVRNNLSFESTWYGSAGWSADGNWQNDSISLVGRVSDINNYQQQSFILSYQNAFRPSIQYNSRQQNNISVTKTSLRTYHHAYLSQLRTSIAISPYYAIHEHNGINSDVIGGRLLANIPTGWQAVAAYQEENRDTSGIDAIHRFEGELSKRFPIGRLTYRHSSIDYGYGWTTQQKVLRADIWQWEHATISLAASRSTSGDDSFSLSISGTFGRNGFGRIPQQNRATLDLSTCRDVNADGVCQDNEPEVTGITVRLGDHMVVTPAIIDSLTPYRQYKVQLSEDFGLSPRYKVIESGPLTRGGINHLRLPLSEVREVEGQLEKDGIRVALVDKKTGSVIGEQTTEFGGWYLFYAPSHLDVDVVEKSSSSSL